MLCSEHCNEAGKVHGAPPACNRMNVLRGHTDAGHSELWFSRQWGCGRWSSGLCRLHHQPWTLRQHVHQKRWYPPISPNVNVTLKTIFDVECFSLPQEAVTAQLNSPNSLIHKLKKGLGMRTISALPYIKMTRVQGNRLRQTFATAPAISSYEYKMSLHTRHETIGTSWDLDAGMWASFSIPSTRNPSTTKLVSRVRRGSILAKQWQIHFRFRCHKFA